MTEHKKNKVFVIGLDGATFEIINPMVQQGELPNIAKMIQGSSYGSLRSCTPDLSPPAWTSFMTGMHPGKHGILDFFGQEPGSYKLNFFNASFRREKPIWTLLSDAGKKVCVINVPLTFPPDKVNGIMISGMDTPALDSDFIYPSTLRQELEREIGAYIIEKPERNLNKNKIDKYVKSLFSVNQNRFNAARYLMKRYDWDLFVVVFESTDRVQHNFWKYMDPAHPEYNKKDNKRYGNVIFDAYKDIDYKTGELINNLPENSTLIILSDHGFGPLYKGVRLNKWFELNSYLTNIRSSKPSWEETLIEQSRRTKLIPKFLKRGLGRFMGLKDKKNDYKILAHLNMDKTRVYPIGGYGHLCINLKGRQPQGIVEPGKEYEELRDELIMKLKALKDPSNGNCVIDKILKREEAYSFFPENTPDILISWRRGYSFLGERELSLLGIRPEGDNLFTPHRWSGNHLPDGILLMRGKDIKADYKITGAEIVDIAPTILALLSEGILENMDGKVLREALEETFLVSNPIKYRRAAEAGVDKDSHEKAYSEEESKKIGEKLRNLGYIE